MLLSLPLALLSVKWNSITEHVFSTGLIKDYITEEGEGIYWSHATHLISIYDDIETSFQNPDAPRNPPNRGKCKM